MSLITVCDNGTFEAAQGTWSASFSARYPAVRSSEQAQAGTFSAKTQLFPATSPADSGSYVDVSILRFPTVIGQPYEATLWVKFTATVPDDLLFTLIGGNNFSEGSSVLTSVYASEGKSVFVRLKVNFVAAVSESLLTLRAVFNKIDFDANPIRKIQFPGIYEKIIADIPHPLAGTDYVYIDTATAELKAMPIVLPPSSKLYYLRNGFLLSDSENVYEIKEPIRWDQVEIQIDWDDQLMGYRYEFSDKDVLLEFDRKSGYDVIKANRVKFGVDLDIMLRFGYFQDDDTFVVLYEGVLNGESYSENEFTIKCNIEKKSFGQKLKSRFDSVVDIFSTTSVDGIELTPLTRQVLFMHPGELNFNGAMIFNTNVDLTPTLTEETIGGGANPPKAYSTPIPFKVNGSNITQLQDSEPPGGMIYYAGASLDPGETSRFIKISVKVNFKFTKSNTGLPISAGFIVYKKGNISGGETGDIDFLPDAASPNVVNGMTGYGMLNGEYFFSGEALNRQFEVLADEGIFIKALIYVANPAGTAPYVFTNFEYIDLEEMYLIMEQSVNFQPSSCSPIFIYEALNRQLEIILDVSNPLKSDIFGRTDLGYAENGGLSQKVLMDGKIVRSFPDKPFNASFKTWLNSLSSLYALGTSLERDEDSNEFVRIEPLENFFRDVKLLSIDFVSKYEKRFDLEKIYNELIFGFNKYPTDNQSDSLKDYLTKLNFALSIRKYSNKMQKFSDILLSTYYLEYTRREAFRVNPANAYETDENTFLVAIVFSEFAYEGIQINFSADGYIYLSGDSGNTLFPVLAGDSLQVLVFAADTDNVGFYTVEEVTVLYPNTGFITRLKVTESFDVAVGSGDILLPSAFGRLQPLTDIGFEGGKASYNPDYTIKQSILKWAKVWQSGLYGFKGEAAWIKFLTGVNNIKVDNTWANGQSITTYFPDTDQLLFNLGELPLFTGYMITFETLLNWDIINRIRKAFEGRDPDDLNYGYFEWTNPDGIVETGWISNLRFKPSNQTCKLTIWERFNEPTI